MSATAYIGLGSNLGDSLTTLRLALRQLQHHPQITQLAVSSLYLSKPVGPQNQPDYYNAAARFTTDLTASDLLTLLLETEQHFGRDRVNQIRWGARTLDLDLLLFNNCVIQLPQLTIPHPYLTQRAFVVCPLLELDPELGLPSGEPLQQYLPALTEQIATLQRLNLDLI